MDVAVIDGRVQKVSYNYSESDKTVIATLPHFWYSAGMTQKIFFKYRSIISNLFYADMDPNFSVLLVDSTEDCQLKERAGKKVNTKVIAIVVPIVVGAILLAAAAVYFYPRYLFK